MILQGLVYFSIFFFRKFDLMIEIKNMRAVSKLALCVYCYNAIPLNKCRIVFEILV